MSLVHCIALKRVTNEEGTAKKKKKKSLTVTVLWLTHHFRNTVDMKDNFDPPYYLISMSLGIF